MHTKIKKIKGDWTEVLNDCRFTVGKKDLKKIPSEKFIKTSLISEHSPIRDILIKWEWLDIKHWVMVHWVRHKWEKFVATQRVDRTGIPRDKLPQDQPTDMRGEANQQQLIDSWRKRLCFRASPETRILAEDFKVTIHNLDNEYKYLADVLVPNCVYRCGCPEMETCGVYKYWLDTCFKDVDIFNIQDRYDAYNTMFYEGHGDMNDK